MSQNPNAGAGPGPQPGYEAWYEEPKESRMSVMAVLSLVFSLLCVTSPIGVILGVVALFMIGGSQGRTHGKGVAIGGVVVGLVCCTCLTFAMVGGMSFMQLMNREAIKPAGQLLADIDAKNYTQARTRLIKSVGDAITDEQFEEFRTAYQAELGASKKMPESIIEMVTGYGGIEPAMNTFGKDVQGSGHAKNVIPMRGDFEKGPAMVGIHMDETRGGSGGKIMPLDNLLIVTNDGKIFWLRDPRTVPVKGVIPSAKSPRAPDAPAAPEAPEAPKEEKPEAKPEGGN